MAAIHENFEDVKVTLGITVAGEIDDWVEVESILSVRTGIQIINTGVSADNETAHSLDVRFFQGTASVSGDPWFRLFAGDSWYGDFAPEVRIAVRSNILNGTYTLIESEGAAYRTQNAPYNR